MIRSSSWRMRMWTGRISPRSFLRCSTVLCRSWSMRDMSISPCRRYIKRCRRRERKSTSMTIRRWSGIAGHTTVRSHCRDTKAWGRWTQNSYGRRRWIPRHASWSGWRSRTREWRPVWPRCLWVRKCRQEGRSSMRMRRKQNWISDVQKFIAP